MLSYFVLKTNQSRLKMEIKFKEIIQHQSDQIMTFTPDDVVVIQTSNHHFDAIICLTCNDATFQMIRNPQFYKRLSEKNTSNFLSNGIVAL